MRSKSVGEGYALSTSPLSGFAPTKEEPKEEMPLFLPTTAITALREGSKEVRSSSFYKNVSKFE